MLLFCKMTTSKALLSPSLFFFFFSCYKRTTSEPWVALEASIQLIQHPQHLLCEVVLKVYFLS